MCRGPGREAGTAEELGRAPEQKGGQGGVPVLVLARRGGAYCPHLYYGESQTVSGAPQKLRGPTSGSGAETVRAHHAVARPRQSLVRAQALCCPQANQGQGCWPISKSSIGLRGRSQGHSRPGRVRPCASQAGRGVLTQKHSSPTTTPSPRGPSALEGAFKAFVASSPTWSPAPHRLHEATALPLPVLFPPPLGHLTGVPSGCWNLLVPQGPAH